VAKTYAHLQTPQKSKGFRFFSLSCHSVAQYLRLVKD
jgi:hypothetical protein